MMQDSITSFGKHTRNHKCLGQQVFKFLETVLINFSTLEERRYQKPNGGETGELGNHDCA